MSTSLPLLDHPEPAQPAPPVGGRGPDERVNQLTSIPFLLLHLLPAAGHLHRRQRDGRRAVRGRSTSGGCSSSPPATTATSPTAATGSTGSGSSCWPSAAPRRRRRARCGGPPTTATTTATPTAATDIHSPTQKGFWWSHVGWILCDKYAATDYDRIKDFAKYPELAVPEQARLDRPRGRSGIACYLIGGWSGLLIGFFLSTVLLWHATFTVNSLAHVFGRRRYDTTDTSRNSARDRAADHGRGLAQQPPLLPGVGPPGLLLVGVRPDLLRPQGAAAGSAS